MSTLQMEGLADLSGQKFDTVSVEGMAQRSPLRWHVHCERCGSRWVEPHTTFQKNAVRCRNGSCFAQHERETRQSRMGRSVTEQPAQGDWSKDDLLRYAAELQREME